MNILKYLRVKNHKDFNYCWVCKEWKKHGKHDDYAEFECAECDKKRKAVKWKVL